MTELDEVIGAVRHADTDAAERWFRVLCDPARAEHVVAELHDHDPNAAESLAYILTTLAAPDETLRAMRDLGADAALARYYALLGAEPSDTDEDLTAWQAFLAEKGPYWDGAEENWQAFRDWFAYEAATAGVPHSAVSFLDYAESTGDKPAAFAAYGIPVTSHPPTADLAEHITAAFANDQQALAALSDAEIDELARRAAETLLADRG